MAKREKATAKKLVKKLAPATEVVAASPKRNARLSLGRARADGEASFPVAPARASLPAGYPLALSEVRKQIEAARLRAVLDANATLTQL